MAVSHVRQQDRVQSVRIQPVPEFALEDCHTPLFVRVPKWVAESLDKVATLLSDGARHTRSDIVRSVLVQFLRTASASSKLPKWKHWTMRKCYSTLYIRVPEWLPEQLDRLVEAYAESDWACVPENRSDVTRDLILGYLSIHADEDFPAEIAKAS